MVSTHWTADDGSLGFSSWSDAVVIRSKSMSERPKPLEHDTVNHDAYRVSFLVAWSQKQQLGLSTSDFEKGCRCFRVRYEYLPGDEHFERRKWQLCQDAFTGSQVQTLVGLRRAQAVQEVERLLQRSGKSSSAGDIEKWFRAGNLQQMSEKTIRAMLRIARRFATVSPEGPLIVAELDSKFQTEHCLSGHTNLDLLCSRTSIPKNSTLENGLLMWVLQSLREDIIKGSLDPNVGGQLLGSIVSMYLLKRRLVLYQVKKFGADHKAFGEAFSSMQTFLKSGLELQQASCLEWLRQAPDYLVEVVTFSAKVLKGHKAIDEVLLKLAMADPKMSPEGALLELEKAGLHDHRALVGLMEDAKQPKVPETIPAPPEADKQAAEQEVSKDVPEELPEDMGDQVAAEDEKKSKETKGLDRLQAFPHLKHHMADLLHDIIYKNPDDNKFANVLDDAIISVLVQFIGRNTYVQLHVTPEDATEWQMLLKGLHLPEDGRLHKIDAKCMHQGPPPEGYGQDMHRNRAVLHDAAFKRSLTTIFGDAGPGSTGVLVQGDLVLICDGRVSRNHQTINREVTKVIKNEKKEGQGQMRLRKYEPVSHLRFLYHNREFEGRRMSRSCSGTSKGANPEPLENVSVIWTKDVTLELRERKFVDLPGNNKARGWASQALKGDEDYMVSLLPRDCLQAMADGTEAPKPPHSDSEESGPEEKETAEVSVLPLHPWEGTEEQAREIVHCFLPKKTSVVIDYFAGLVSAVACARDKVRYIGFVRNTTSLSVLSEMVLLRIVLDMVQDRADGFRRATRHLSKSLSLGGESAPTENARSPFTASPKLSVDEEQDRLCSGMPKVLKDLKLSTLGVRAPHIIYRHALDEDMTFATRFGFPSSEFYRAPWSQQKEFWLVFRSELVASAFFSHEEDRDQRDFAELEDRLKEVYLLPPAQELDFLKSDKKYLDLHQQSNESDS
ncbi:unnamed protein product [Symbiodinium microadriaticum]|nr:unnamed protein product [Symbiodinium microadriaticum]